MDIKVNEAEVDCADPDNDFFYIHGGPTTEDLVVFDGCIDDSDAILEELDSPFVLSFSGNIFDSPNVSRKSYRCEE